MFSKKMRMCSPVCFSICFARQTVLPEIKSRVMEAPLVIYGAETTTFAHWQLIEYWKRKETATTVEVCKENGNIRPRVYHLPWTLTDHEFRAP